MNVDATLTHAERAAPFQAAPADTDPLTGPTRTALEIVESDNLFTLFDRDLSTGDDPIEITVIAKKARH